MPMYDPKWRDAYFYGSNFMPEQPRTFTNKEYRQQPPHPLIQGMNGAPYPYLNSYPNPYYQPIQGVSPYYLQPLQGTPAFQQQQPMFQQPVNTSAQKDVFQNPLHPLGDTNVQQQQPLPSANGYPYMNPYPKGSFLAKQPSGVQSVLNSFKSQDGSLDISKMVDTAGQMMNAVSQVSSVVKGFGGMFKA